MGMFLAIVRTFSRKMVARRCNKFEPKQDSRCPSNMRIPLRTKSTAFALIIGVVIGMLVPMMYTWAQNQGTIQTPFGPVANPRASQDPCEQYYQEAITANATPNATATTTEKAMLYLACREHSKPR